MEYIIGSVLILFSLIIIFVVLLQEGRQANVGVISGAADSFLDKGAAKTLDQKLAKWTKVIAVAFFALVLAGMLLTNYYAEQIKNPTVEGSTQSENVSNESTNDVELDWSEDESDKKGESDEKDEADKKDETGKKEEADHDHNH